MEDAAFSWPKFGPYQNLCRNPFVLSRTTLCEFAVTRLELHSLTFAAFAAVMRSRIFLKGNSWTGLIE